MALVNAKAIKDGQEIDVQIDDQHFVPIEQHRTRLQTTVEERLTRQRTSLRSELESDPEFVKTLIKKAGFDPDRKGGDMDGAAIERIQSEIRAKEVEPLKKRAGDAEAEVQSIRRDSLLAELKSALIEKGCKPHLAEKFARMEAEGFKWDAKTKMFALKKGADEFEFSANATAERPYKGTAEWAEGWASDQANGDFVTAPQRQAAPGVGDTSRRGGANVKLTRAEARDNATYRAAEEKAAKQGGAVEIID